MVEKERISNIETNKTFDDFDKPQQELLMFLYQNFIGKMEYFSNDVQRKISILNARTESLSKIKKIQYNDLNDIVTNNNFVIVDVWDLGCPPCDMLAPIFEQYSYFYNGTKFCKLKWTEELGKRYNIELVPTILFFHNGHLQDRIEGLPKEDDLEKHIIFNKVTKDEYTKKLEIVKKIASSKNWILNPDPVKQAALVVGLIENQGFCPCKKSKVMENKCPCRPTQEHAGSEKEIQENGSCYCGLFMKK